MHWVASIVMIAALAGPAAAAEPGRITGVGGIFFKSKDPKALTAWYRDVLGIPIQSWGGALMPYDAPGHPPFVVVNAFAANTDYFQPSGRDYMLNFAVDDMDAFIARLKSKGVAVLKQDDSDPSGRFAWIVDPDGTKIELWQPKPKP
jgi:predicted enzyme related to lactoylglutathione lyase